MFVLSSSLSQYFLATITSRIQIVKYVFKKLPGRLKEPVSLGMFPHINILAAEMDRAPHSVVVEVKDTNCLCPKGCLQVSIQSAFIPPECGSSWRPHRWLKGIGPAGLLAPVYRLKVVHTRTRPHLKTSHVGTV